MQASFTVTQVGPSVSVQDAGRIGHKRFGVSSSGVMDRTAYTIANTALENSLNTPVIEVSLGGITLECREGSVSLALAGGHFSALLNNAQIPAWSLFTVTTGDTLSIRPGAWGSWSYLAFAGHIESMRWLGSQSVHLNSGIGGKPLTLGNVITINDAYVHTKSIISLGNPDSLKPTRNIRVVVGPQERFFEQETLDNLLSRPFTVTPEYDRMGMRLSGCTLPVNAALDMPSEPISRGSLQVPGHGDPICLLADHQSAGGYPKIATVISADQDRLSQHRSGDTINFDAVDPITASHIAREREAELQDMLKVMLLNKVSLTERLWANNLISGTSSGLD